MEGDADAGGAAGGVEGVEVVGCVFWEGLLVVGGGGGRHGRLFGSKSSCVPFFLFCTFNSSFLSFVSRGTKLMYMALGHATGVIYYSANVVA